MRVTTVDQCLNVALRDVNTFSGCQTEYQWTETLVQLNTWVAVIPKHAAQDWYASLIHVRYHFFPQLLR